METPAPTLEVGSTALPLGTKVGSWRVYGIRGQGTYGTVYSAVSQEREHPGPAALKLAVHPGDPRFEREVELLSRIRHPSVPRLLDSGLWQDPAGRVHPFVVMEWVEGEPLYVWAARRNPSSRQVLALVAQAAGALQATHEVSGVHRDVKGDNMLVRPWDGRLFLTDFGAGYFAGATRLTPLHMLPGTPDYRSPELWDSARRAGSNATAPLVARPSDDVFALGVTAYRLVTDTYPPFTHLAMNGGQRWLLDGSGAPSPRPEERGTAGELAEAMQRGVAHAGPSADGPLFEWETLEPFHWTGEERAEAELLGHRPRRRNQARVRRVEQADAAERAQVERREAEARVQATALVRKVKARRWLPWLAAAIALGLWPEETGSVLTEPHPTEGRSSSKKERAAVSLAETAQSVPTALSKDPVRGAIAEEIPKNPWPGQLKPDAKGRCPNKQIAINGGCWLKVDFVPEECPGNGFMYQGGCYVPFFVPSREPASAPQER